MSRFLRGTVFFGIFAVVLAAAGAGLAQEPGKCKLATKGDGPVAKACTEGGIKKAKQVMKDLLKQGKAAGLKHDCDDCHKDDADYAQLTDDAKDKFQKLLAAVAKK
jgi:hypothetical protein